MFGVAKSEGPGEIPHCAVISVAKNIYSKITTSLHYRGQPEVLNMMGTFNGETQVPPLCQYMP